MCTAISDVRGSHLFGRTLDLECSYGEGLVILPCRFPLKFLHGSPETRHFAMIGTAHIENGQPLFYDAMNEYGLCGAALNFPGYAKYAPYCEGKTNLASFEVLPRVLAECRSTDEAVKLLSGANITDEAFSKELPTTPLHWIFADRARCITVEPTVLGVIIYDNPCRTLTNAPSFPYHMTNLANYMNLTAMPPENTLCPDVSLSPYSRGMGAIGLPGDFSSASRFVRAAFVKHNTTGADGSNRISRFFHIMDTVGVPKGAVMTSEGAPVLTIYTSCADTESLTYYFTTYACRRIRAVRLDRSSAGSDMKVVSMDACEDILYNEEPVR